MCKSLMMPLNQVVCVTQSFDSVTIQLGQMWWTFYNIVQSTKKEGRYKTSLWVDLTGPSRCRSLRQPKLKFVNFVGNGFYPFDCGRIAVFPICYRFQLPSPQYFLYTASQSMRINPCLAEPRSKQFPSPPGDSL